MSFFYEAIIYLLVQHIMGISCTESVFIIAMKKDNTHLNGPICIQMGMKLINAHGFNSFLICGH